MAPREDVLPDKVGGCAVALVAAGATRGRGGGREQAAVATQLTGVADDSGKVAGADGGRKQQ